MKTAGELLKEKRLALELGIAEVAQKTKIKEEYLTAIEESTYDRLPSATFAKGFLRSYANCVHLSPDTIVAMFRRDFTETKEGEIIPRGLITPVVQKPRFVTAQLLLMVIGVVAFGTFLLWQLVSWWSLPKLQVIQPQEGGTYGGRISVRGEAERDASVSINEQKVILNGEGEFSLDLVLSPGTQRLLVTATNRQGKSRVIERTFTVVP